jgi:hypothetical protein
MLIVKAYHVNQETELENACEWSVKNNIKITRGALFDRSAGKEVIACDAIGAFLFYRNADKIHMEKGWLKNVCDLLNVDTFWLWNFWMGFDRSFQVMIEKSNGHSTYFEPDKTAKFGIKLAKQFVKG